MRNMYAYFADVYLYKEKFKITHSRAMMIGSNKYTERQLHWYNVNTSTESKKIEISIKKIRNVTIDDINQYQINDNDLENLIKYAQLCNMIDYKYNIRKARKENVR